MTKGILLIATNEGYYGKMAYNLAVSIKAVEDFPVAVLANDKGLGHLLPKHKEIFDNVIQIEEDVTGSEVKLLAYKYSPFDKTLFIDSDNLWLPVRKPSELFKQLAKVKFTAITEGKLAANKADNDASNTYLSWSDPKATMKAYDVRELYQWRSEVFYFSKNKAVEELFEKAIEVSRNPQVDVQKFASGVPDEFALGVAAAQVGIEPHKYKWQPTFWEGLSGRLPAPANLYNEYWVLSTGGKRNTTAITNLYNNIVKSAHNKLRLQHRFNLQPKRIAMTDRRYL